MLSAGLFHIQKRKRTKNSLKPYPHNNLFIKTLDRAILLLAVIGPAATIPQILEIFLNKDAGSVSVLSWSIFMLFDIPWIIYGFVHKEKPIIVAYVLWFFTNALIVVGALLY